MHPQHPWMMRVNAEEIQRDVERHLRLKQARETARGHRYGMVAGMRRSVGQALIAAGTFFLAQLPWFALPALLLVPAAVMLPSVAGGGPWRRAFAFGLPALAAGAVTVLAAWFAARGGLS